MICKSITRDVLVSRGGGRGEEEGGGRRERKTYRA